MKRVVIIGSGNLAEALALAIAGSGLELLQLFARNPERKIGVYLISKKLDEEVARLHLAKLGAKLTTLTQEQADYIGVPVEGPYKPESYRY